MHGPVSLWRLREDTQTDACAALCVAVDVKTGVIAARYIFLIVENCGLRRGSRQALTRKKMKRRKRHADQKTTGLMVWACQENPEIELIIQPAIEERKTALSNSNLGDQEHNSSRESTGSSDSRRSPELYRTPITSIPLPNC